MLHCVKYTHLLAVLNLYEIARARMLFGNVWTARNAHLAYLRTPARLPLEWLDRIWQTGMNTVAFLSSTITPSRHDMAFHANLAR